MFWQRVRSFALVPLLFAAACAPAAPATGGIAPPAREVKDFSLRIGNLSIDPTVDSHLTIGDIRRSGLYEALVAQDDQGKVVPDLATACKNTAPTTWEFTLAQGRKFSDGSPLTAEDVKFSYVRALNPDLKLGILVRVGTVEKVDIVSPQTFRITTKAPDPLLLKRAAMVAIVSKHRLISRAVDRTWQRKALVPVHT